MAQLLEAGMTVTLAGMGVVFVLLMALVGVIELMSRLCRLIEARGARACAHAPAVDDELVGVIGAAIRMHRQRRERRS